MKAVMFKAMVVSENSDGTFKSNIQTRSTEDLPDGDVLIHVHYSSLNYKDVLSSKGNRGVTRNYPHTPGVDASGIVIESNNDTIKKGDEVLVTGYDLGMNTSGGFAEYIRVPSDWVVPLPDGLSIAESMYYGTAGFTAGLACNSLIENGVTTDQGPILVTGATGGVGSITVSILSKLGYDVTAINGHNDRTEFLKSIGANEIISLDQAIDTSGKALLKPLWAGVLDAVGGDVLSTAIRSAKPHSTVTTCGNVSSGELHTSVYPFILRGITLSGIDSATTPMPLRLTIWKKLAGAWKPESLKRVANDIIELESLPEQIERVIAHKRTGKAVIRISG